MQKLVKQLSALSGANAGKPANAAQIILCQKQLHENGFAPLPNEYTNLLHYFNAFAWNGSFLYGIKPFKDFFLDLIGENMLAFHPLPEHNIILGCNEYDYLVWNCADACYQIIDKSEFMVLNTYADGACAIRHILKIEDDEQYL